MLISHLEVSGKVFELILPLLVLLVLGVVLDGPVVGSGGVVETEIQIAIVYGLLYLKPRSHLKHVLDGKVEEEV